MRHRVIALFSLAVLLGLGNAASAKKLLAPEIPVWEKFPELSTVRTLDVEFFAQSPAIEGQTPGAELPVTAVKTLQHNTLLPFKSPSDAVLRFSCESFDCTVVKAEIVRRSATSAPAVWEYKYSVFRWPQMPYYKLETADVAQKIMDKLLSDVRAARLAQNTTVKAPEAVQTQTAQERIEPDTGDKTTP